MINHPNFHEYVSVIIQTIVHLREPVWDESERIGHLAREDDHVIKTCRWEEWEALKVGGGS